MSFKNIAFRIVFSSLRYIPVTLFVVVILPLLSGKKMTDASQTIIWKLDNTKFVGGYKAVILGNPMVVKDIKGKSISFNGIDDGIVISKIPIESWKQFTIEVLFKPAKDGPLTPRFIHFEDKEMNRGTFELRLTNNGQWYMDTFLKNGKTGQGLTLIDSTILHKADQWYWAAIMYDGKKMTSYVNGKKELEGIINIPPFTIGDLSMGVRLNKVNWYKGLIKEIRFHSAALDNSRLQKR